ncbi:MAG: hypothetical protein RJB13_994 [Pseudomonadota bacterium]
MHEFTAEDFQLGHLACSLLKTADGSYSLRYKSGCSDNAPWTEPMHSSKGAWSETLHVYFPALLESMALPQKTEPWKVASVGLGLGYNEILCSALGMKFGLRSDQLKVYSFESEQPLQSSFLTFFKDSEKVSLPPALKFAYQNICDLVCSHLQLSQFELQSYITQLVDCGSLELHGRLDTEHFDRPEKNLFQSHCVLFDAFSPDSSPLLWKVELLESIVTELCAPSCRFVSYASRTALKRVLVSKGFQLSKTSGFAGKRECTFALRSEATCPCEIKKD